MASNRLAHAALIDLGFKCSSADPCLYSHVSPDSTLYLSLYVDDLVYAGLPSATDLFKEEFSKMFNIKDLGPAKFVVGLQISQSSEGISISQSTYITKVLEDTDIPVSHPSSISSLLAQSMPLSPMTLTNL